MTTSTELSPAQRAALSKLAGHARSVLRADVAAKIGAAFEFDVTPLVYHPEKGVDWGARREVWDEGAAVNASTLAWRLADHLGAPDVKYDTDYGGAGKRSEAITLAAVTAIRVHHGIKCLSCVMCGAYDTDAALCFDCERALGSAYEPDVHAVPAMNYARTPTGEKETEWWVREWAAGTYRSFPTEEQAVQFGVECAQAREELRARYGAAMR